MAGRLPGRRQERAGDRARRQTASELLVADYSQGVGIGRPRDGVQRPLLPRQDGKPLRGIDGLVRCGSTYYGIYNGAAPGLLLSITLTDDGHLTSTSRSAR